MTFCRELGTHKASDASTLVSGGTDRASSLKPINYITDQIGKRIFWVMVAGVRSMQQMGASINEIPIPPPNAQQPYPEMPLEVDDEYIFADHVLPQPEGTMSLITGFNRNINTYLSMNELIGIDMCYGQGYYRSTPPELQVDTANPQAERNVAFLDESGFQYCPPAFPATQPAHDVRHAFAEQPSRRRKLQLEIQKANIYASQLATRSYYVERYLNLRDTHRAQSHVSERSEGDAKDEVDLMITNERELIVQHLLTVLTTITQRNMEPNGASLVNKIRQVASTLLNDAPERKGPMAMKAEEYLSKFLDIMMKLEKTGTVAGGQTAQ
ncbi:Fungal transcriptional regulatory protein [Apiospora saccharicola]